MIYLHTKIHIPRCSGSSITAIKQKVKYSFCMGVNILFYDSDKRCILLKISANIVKNLCHEVVQAT